MKKSLLLLFAILTLGTAWSQGFTVTNYVVDVTISEEGFFDVVENYDVNFDQRKHGILRDIRTKYDLVTEEGKKEKRRIEISNIEVPDHKFEATGKFMRKTSEILTIKIGDKNKTIIGPVHYEIRYRVKNAFLYESEATRFYWNLKPTQWIAPFEHIEFRVHIPDNISIGRDDCFVYSGVAETTAVSTDFTTEYTQGTLVGRSVAGYVSRYGEAVTVLIDLPPGSIKEIQPFWPFWTKYGWLLLIGALVTAFYMIWRKYGKDERVPTTITYFPPEAMDPAMAGFLINDRSDTSDLVSLFPFWGANGHIAMEEIPKKGLFSKKDTRITKLKDLPGDAPDYQRKIFNGLFSGRTEVLVSSLKDSFYTTMASARSQLKKAGQQYYDPKARAVKMIVAGVLVLLCLILAPLVFYLWGVLATVLVFVCCVLLLIMNIYMIKKNKRGDTVFSELKGFRQFIKTAEEKKLKMLLDESPHYFEATMGYALTFGAFALWAKKFSALNVPPPSWYTGTMGSHSSMNNFSKSFSSSMSAASSTLVSSPSSSGSGGGSSGGGFGGGGGGSW